MNSQKSILIVDDDPVLLVGLRRDLATEGFAVLLARDGEEAIAQLSEHPAVDLVVIDIMMPDMDGRELAEQVRAQYPDAKLLFISGSHHEGLATLLKELDATFLSKPFSKGEFAQTIRTVLE